MRIWRNISDSIGCKENGFLIKHVLADMWKCYSGIVQRYPRISLSEERRLILEAQNGSKESRDELVLRHIDFLRFRIRRIIFPHLVQRFGDDVLGEAILIIYEKIESYDLDYRDKQGKPHPVKFISYIWKRIDGFIIDFMKKDQVLGIVSQSPRL